MNLKDLIAKVTGSESKITALESQVGKLLTDFTSEKERADSLNTQVESLTSKVTYLEEDNASLKEGKTKAETKVEELAQENTEMKDKLEDPEGTIQTEASKKAQNVLAQTGTPPIEDTKEGEASADGKSVVEQYLAISDPAQQHKFFTEHYKEINAALRGGTA